ncbi:hypothetical protein ACN6MY_05865 [Peribacillus sp. B-H-3]|jgi:hypothetical protein|uniref:hypothetical protein n=1 Tax=Bacillaceae TaxID=186817 RepID=UPI0008DEC929|nr:hypothetical protein [Bacillus sp. OV322]SFC85974.1 hypothetical protein SAMN05443252_10781 [Bacillus sp. OV322]
MNNNYKHNNYILYFLAILSGFALVILPGLVTAGALASFVASIAPVAISIGLITVVVFSLVLIYLAFKSLFA